MGKDFSADVLRIMDVASCQAVVVPDDMYNAALKDSRRVLPYAAVAASDIKEVDFVVVHKGLMHRLGHDALAVTVLLFEVVHADEVFVCYGRVSANFGGARIDVTENMMTHVPPVRNFLRSEQILRQRKDSLRSALLVSAYGVGNIGDDLVSLAAKKMLEDVGIPEVTLSGPMASYKAICETDVLLSAAVGYSMIMI
ncbi:hypothetical protein ACRS3T_15080 [Burkholderia cenocepacia]